MNCVKNPEDFRNQVPGGNYLIEMDLFDALSLLSVLSSIWLR
jgi:hypothetical protein